MFEIRIVVVALLECAEDAWSLGERIKDLGPIHRERRVRFCFGEPLPVEGRGQDYFRLSRNALTASRWESVV